MSPTAPHLVTGASGWAYCSEVVLRATGFPVEDALALAAPELVALVAAGADTAEVREAYTRDGERGRAALRHAAGRPAFREALLWQSPIAARGLDRWLADVAARENYKARTFRELLVLYLQRYTTKNDTIGFFGPIGWARLDGSAGDAAAARPGPALLRHRVTEFEHWAMVALADALAAEPALRRHLRPRRLPTVEVDGDELVFGAGRRTRVSPLAAALIRACDGTRAPAEIAAELPAGADGGAVDPAEVEELLLELVDENLVSWTLDVPFHPDLRPERALREALDALPDGAERASGLAALDEMEGARAAVSRAAGDPARLEPAMADLRETFERLAGERSSRRGGEMYAAREIVYEDCVRDYDLSLGADVLARLDGPLSLLLQSARWCCHQAAAAYREIFREATASLAAELGARAVPLAALLGRVRPAFQTASDRLPPPLVPIMRAHEEAWAEILAWPAGARRVGFTAEELRPRVAARFAAPDGGFPHAQVHSPDVLLGARGAADLEAGRFQIVLGEIHVATDTLAKPAFLTRHPRARELGALVDSVHARPLVEWVAPLALQSHVVQVTSDPLGVSIEMDRARAWRQPDRVFRVAELVAEERDGEVRIRSRDGRLDVEAVDFASFELSAHIGSGFRVVRGDHCPRIAIDDVVVARERWQFVPAEIPALAIDDRADRFAALRRWAEAQGLPRWIFFRTPEEVKPLYVDLDSPFLVECAARTMRRGSAIAMSEMLPTPLEAWVEDGRSGHYTSELRLLAIDPARYAWR